MEYTQVPPSLETIFPPNANDKKRGRDPLYLFFCHLEWRLHGNVKAYQDIVAALDDCDPEVRLVAENLLHRPSPRPARKPFSDH